MLAGLERAESEVRLQYVLFGMFKSPVPTIYFSASDIPGLGTSRYGDYSGEDTFLVFKAGTEINVEEIPQNKGGVLYEVGMLANPTAISFQPSTQFGEKTIIEGGVGTATAHPSSIPFCKWFWRRLGAGFKQVGIYHVGPEAYRRLETGWRLTAATQCPPEYDLRLT
jgi:hypothetical protein